MSDTLEGFNRKWKTFWCWSHIYLGFKAAQARSRMLPLEKQDAYWKQKHSYFAEKVWNNIASLRGWWVKVGQFLSTRSDMLPEEYIEYLTRLQDMMPKTQFSAVKAIVENEYGKPIDEVFLSFEEEAIAAASIGQVHKAFLLDGTPVVVKVQHADVHKTLRQDMQTLTQLSWVFGLIEGGVNFTPVLEEWQKAATFELDFRIELIHQVRAYEGAKKGNLDVIIPKCYPSLTTQKVMVMDFCEGFKITDLAKLDEHNVDRAELMTSICEAFAYQIHMDGMFNGDPHPGNILANIDPVTGKCRAVLLDWGLVKVWGDKERIAFSKMVFAIATMDVMGLMGAFEEMGFVFKSKTVIDPEFYMDALRVGFFRDSGDSPIVDQSQASSAIQKAKEANVDRQTIAEGNPLEDWPKDIIFFIRVASLLHGLCLQLEAKVPFLDILVNRARQCLYERYVPPSPLVYVRYPSNISISSDGTITRQCTRQLLKKAKKLQHSKLEWRVHQLLCKLRDKKRILGCQVSVILKNKVFVDISVGEHGPIDRRPVNNDSLFTGGCVCKGIVATAVLMLVDSGALELDDKLCHFWDGFVRFQKRDISVRHVLSHRAGLHRALPKDLTLSKFTDYESMIHILEDAVPCCQAGAKGRYAFLTAAWIFSEIVRSVSSQRIDEFVKDKIVKQLGLQYSFFYPIPETLTQVEQSMAATSSSSVTQKPSKIGPLDADHLASRAYLLEEVGIDDLQFHQRKRKSSGLPGDPPHHSTTRSSSLHRPDDQVELSVTAADSPLRKTVPTHPNTTAADNRSKRPAAIEVGDVSRVHQDEPLQFNSEQRVPNELLGGSSCSSTAAESFDSSGFSNRRKGDVMTYTMNEADILRHRSDSRIMNKKQWDDLQLQRKQRALEVVNSPANSERAVDDAIGVGGLSGVKSTLSLTGSDITQMKASQNVSHNDSKVIVASANEKSLELSFASGAIAKTGLSTDKLDNSSSNTSSRVVDSGSTSSRVVDSGSTSSRVVDGTDGKGHSLSSPRKRDDSSLERKRKNVTSSVIDRLTFGSREIKISAITNEEVMEKIEKAKVFAGLAEKKSSGILNSKYIRKVVSQSLQQKIRDPHTISAMELLKRKPHVIDPLICDSRRLYHLLIPPTNGRFTARALAVFYNALAAEKLISKQTLIEAMQIATTDNTLDTLFATGGSSRHWGLGYQLFPCLYNPRTRIPSNRNRHTVPSSFGVSSSPVSTVSASTISRRSPSTTKGDVIKTCSDSFTVSGKSGTKKHLSAIAQKQSASPATPNISINSNIIDTASSATPHQLLNEPTGSGSRHPTTRPSPRITPASSAAGSTSPRQRRVSLHMPLVTTGSGSNKEGNGGRNLAGSSTCSEGYDRRKSHRIEFDSSHSFPKNFFTELPLLNGDTVMGVGHSDMGGSVALCFPELRLSICILVNDYINGPKAVDEVLRNILDYFGVTPNWDVAVNIGEVFDGLSGR